MRTVRLVLHGEQKNEEKFKTEKITPYICVCNFLTPLDLMWYEYFLFKPLEVQTPLKNMSKKKKK